LIELRRVSKQYGNVNALIDVSFTVEKGEVLTILGPNGSGKTTLLKLLACLEVPSQGEIFYEDMRIEGSNMAEFRHRSTMVFQRTTLFRGSVFDNLAYGLRQSGLQNEAVKNMVNESLKIVHLEDLVNRKAKTLSGGEQKRLSLARALVLDRELVLLDEPLANLDPESLAIVKESIRLMRDLETTVILATHNIVEAENLSDRFVLLDQGRVIEIGLTREHFKTPSTEFTRFARTENIFSGVSRVVNGVSHVDIGDGLLIRGAFAKEGKTTIHVQPKDIIVSLSKIESSARNTLLGRVVSIEIWDPIVRLRVDVGRLLTVQITNKSFVEMGFNIGQEVYLTFKASSVLLV
jgi:molybdopterin-binding protein